MKRKMVLMLTGLTALALGMSGAAGCKSLKTGPAFEDGKAVIAAAGCKSAYKLVTDEYAETDTLDAAAFIVDALRSTLNARITQESGRDIDDTKYILAFGASEVPECFELTQALKKDEYAIKVSKSADADRIVVAVAFKGDLARTCAVDRLLTEFYDAENGRLALSENTDIKGSVTPEESLITTPVSLRDPCIVLENGVYYMYGTGWKYFKNTSGSLAGAWEGPFQMTEQKPEDSDTQYWAPEVHKYNGAFYMFATYHKVSSDHRGCAIFRADTPEGPFEMISNGHVTPAEWDCIDGTLYVDNAGQPWMVFVHEWTGNADGIGRMSVAKLSPDLTKLISEPKDIFMGTDAPWATGKITDGPWLYTASDGSLLMLWSNFDEAGYAVGMARSESGKITGPWKQLPYELYSQRLSASYDGGHGMLFRDTDGQLYLSIHSPNGKTGNRETLAIFVPVHEIGNTLWWEFKN